MTLRVFEAFAGYGSQSMALKRLGVPFEVVGISEIDKVANRAYQLIHGETFNFGDISKINAIDLPDFDLFTYSFPCQDISTLGKQKGVVRGETRSGLLYECEKIIEAKRPKLLLLENVKNLVGKNFKPQFDEWLSYLESLGYTNYWQVLNAKDYGVPQNRERVFVVSILGDHQPFQFPKPVGFVPLTDYLKLNPKDLREEIKVSETVKPSSRFYFERDAKQILTTDKPIWACQFCSSGWQDHKVGIQYTPTLRAMGSPVSLLDGNLIRKVSTKEAYQLMGVSIEDFNKIENEFPKTHLFKMAGNSIVVDVLVHLFNEMLKAVNVDVESI